MNFLLVNPIHPQTPHISATRAWRFAQALATMGHRVVLLTGTASDPQAAPAADIGDHDWRHPLVFAVAHFDVAGPAPGRLRLLRRLATAWRLLRHGGHQAAWSSAALSAAVGLSPAFRPDAIWTTFGRMEAVVTARRIARQLRVPWVLDLKDNWEIFVPAPLRRVMAHRVRGWHALTSNAKAHADFGRRWHGAEPHVIYSGVDEAFLGAGGETAPAVAMADASSRSGRTFVLNLVGSLYYEDRLAGLLGGIAAWTGTLSPHERSQVVVRYLGGDMEMFDRFATQACLGVEVEACGYVPVPAMAKACRDAAANMYIAHDGSFHHKLLELLACGRPVLCYPTEGEEGRGLAARLRGELVEPADTAAIIDALRAVHGRWSAGDVSPASADDLYRQLSWESQAGLLEGVLIDATRR